MRLRPATAGDEPFLRAVYASSRADELALTDWNEQQKAAFCDQQFSAQDSHYRAHYPGAEFSIVELEGTPAGRLYVDRWEAEIRIMDIVLLPQFRRASLGTELLRELQREATAAGKSLTIHVERFNPALTLYQRLGFVVREEKGVYQLMEWRGAPPIS